MLRVLRIIVILIIATACGSPEPRSDRRTPPSTPQTRTPIVPPSGGNDAEHYRTQLALVAGSNGQPSDLDRFWRAEFGNLRTGGYYVTPNVIGALRADQQTRCGPVVQNAAYCRVDQSIAWDESWLRDVGGAFSRNTDMGPLTIIAHEWGHHIQRVTEAPGLSIAAELQADCFAGLYIHHLSQGRSPITLESGDVREAAITFFRIGDQQFNESSWFQRDVHGPPLERSRAFRRAYLAGQASECVAYTAYRYRPPITAGPYRIHLRPQWEMSSAAGADPIEIQGPGCTVQMRYLPTLPAAPAADQIENVKRAWFGAEVKEVNVPNDASFAFFNQGTAVGLKYEQVVQQASSAAKLIHGLLFLHVRPTGGGIVVDAFVDGPARSVEEDSALQTCAFVTLEGFEWN